MAVFSSLADKSASINFDKLKEKTYKIKTYSDDSTKKTTRCAKILQSTVKCTGYVLVLAFVGICVYMDIYYKWNEHFDGCKQSSNSISKQADQCSIDENNRFDCFPEKTEANETACLSRGCWKVASRPNTAPWCFYPFNYHGYSASDVKETATGITARLQRTTSSFFPPDVKTLKLSVEYQTNTRLRLRVSYLVV